MVLVQTVMVVLNDDDVVKQCRRYRSTIVRNPPGLKAFVPEGIPWAHLDIAGPAWASAGYGVTPAGATGFGVRLLSALLVGLDSQR